MVNPSKRKVEEPLCGPWDMPPTKDSIAAAREAKRKRQKRKQIEETARQVEQASAAAENASAMQPAKAEAEGDDEYD